MLIIDPQVDTTFYTSVRSLLGGVDEYTLPNADISDPAILDLAELTVLGRIKDYNLLTDTEKSRLKLAVIYMMAAILCSSMANRVIIEEKTIDVTWKKKAIDYDELALKLLAKVEDLLNGIAEVGGDSSIFAIAPSKRAVKEKLYEHERAYHPYSWKYGDSNKVF